MADENTPLPEEQSVDARAEPAVSEWGAEPSDGTEVPLQAVFDTLEAFSGQLKGQNGRVNDLEETVGELAAAVSKLLEQEKKKRKPRRYRFDALDREGQKKLWCELADFVDYLNSIFGTSAYSEHQEWRIPDWWWREPIVVFELLALKAAHDEAFTSTTPNAPTTELIAWLDRWFWPCMNRIFNNVWGLKLSPAPGKPNSKFSVENAVNDRTEFEEHLRAEFETEDRQTVSELQNPAAGAVALPDNTDGPNSAARD